MSNDADARLARAKMMDRDARKAQAARNEAAVKAARLATFVADDARKAAR